MKSEIFDVAILGSGLGGSILAATLARLGLRVLILERRAQPRPFLGESMPRRASLILWMLGQQYDVPEILDLSSTERLNERAVATCGARRSYGFLYHEAGKRQEAAHCQLVVPPALPFCSESHLFRRDIDLYLIAAARRYGAVYRERAQVAGLATGAAGVMLRCVDGAVYRARYVVDDSGREAPVAAHFGLRQEPPPLRTHTRSIYTHVKGLRRYDELLEEGELDGLSRSWFRGTLHHVFDGGTFWVIPFDNHEESINPLASVGVTLDLSRFPHPAASPETELAFLAARYPSIAAHLEGASPVRPWMATDRLQFTARSCVAERCFLLPSSAAFVDRFYGGDLGQTCEVLYALIPRLVAGLAASDLREERFEELELWRAARTSVDDQWMALSLRAAGHFETWLAWLRLWLADAAHGEVRWLARCDRFLQSGDRSALAAHDDDLRVGAGGAGGPLAAWAERGESILLTAGQGGDTPERVAQQLFELVERAPLPPIYPGGSEAAGFEPGDLRVGGAPATPLKTKRPPRFPEAAPS